ncbi:MAG: class I SAM-dependent methyltransferase [Clostridiales bacterium]|nr:class I SAM-dependent methyltransferase [Clostridiales bacterium]
MQDQTQLDQAARAADDASATVAIELKEEMETLLIPLYGRARMSQMGYFHDTDAEEAVRSIRYDFSKLRIQEKTQVMLSVRGAQIDAFTVDFLRAHPDSTAVYLGCGLDARAKRLNMPARLWYDLDFPEVIDIKRRLYPETERYRLIGSSVTRWEWMDQVERNGRPLLVIAEGLLMYLSPQEVETLFLKLRDRFEDVTFVFDAYSRLTAKQAGKHPSLKKTGASIRWGTDVPEEMTAFGDGISHEATIYLTDERAVKLLPEQYRGMFRFAGRFRAAREAHRIFVMRLQAK